MATVTDIQPQKRRQGYYNLFVDNKFLCSLSELSLQTSSYRINQDLNDDELASLVALSDDGKIKDKCLRYLAIRMRSRYEMEQYLRRKEVLAPKSIEILEWLEGLGYIDDQAFAEAWVRDRVATHRRSKRKLQIELRAKGVAADTVEQVLKSPDVDDEAVIRGVIDKKVRLSRYQDKQKLQRYLLQQGFSYDLVRSATATISFDSTQTDTQ